jgi:gluconate 2-dehydrogenase gamma chain
MTDDRFFDAHQRATVAAAMARMIPTDDAPGAREAGTIDFLDRYLSGVGYVFAKPDGSGFETLEGKQAWAWEQRINALRDTYVAGIAELDDLSRTRFDAEFVALTGDQQDRVLTELEQPAQEQEEQVADDLVRAAWTPPEPALQQSVIEIGLGFVPLLALHTRQGFYADPIYGGNRERVGWDVIGFPGPASLAEVHSGRYSVLDYFADRRGYPGTEDERDA